MPKYRFNVQDGVKYEDPQGTRLKDDKAALAEGAQIAREVKADCGDECADWVVEIKDGKRLVERIDFRNVEQHSGSRQFRKS